MVSHKILLFFLYNRQAKEGFAVIIEFLGSLKVTPYQKFRITIRDYLYFIVLRARKKINDPFGRAMFDRDEAREMKKWASLPRQMRIFLFSRNDVSAKQSRPNGTFIFLRALRSERRL